jgi:protein O-mannosyl-transferase
MKSDSKNRIQVKPKIALQGNKIAQKKKSTNSLVWALLAILGITVLVYGRALYNGFSPLDDDDYILRNPVIRDFSLSGLKSIFSSFYIGMYEPLTMLTYMIEYALFGLKPLPYHLTNILLHLLNTWLVFIFIDKLCGKKIAALFVAALFALHPMHVESVAWISERKDVLYTFFFLLSLLYYLNYAKANGKKKYYFVSLLFFIGSLFSKSAAVILTALVIGLDFYLGRKINAKSLLEKIPFLLLSILFGVISLYSQNIQQPTKDISMAFNSIDRIFLISYSLVFYPVKLLLPFNLSAIYYYPDKLGGFLPWYYYASLPLLCCIVWIIFRRSAYKKIMIAGFLFYFISISLVLQIISVGYTITADRYSYVSYIGLFFIAGYWISDMWKTKKKNFIMLVLAAILILFSYLSWVRIGIWKNGETLYTDALNKNNGNYLAWWSRGIYRSNNDNLPGALEDFDKALAINPGFNKAYKIRGMFRAQAGDKTGALEDLQKAISVEPDDAVAWENLGSLKVMMDDYKGAVDDYSHSLKLDSKSSSAYYNRGFTLFTLKDTAGACSDWTKAMALGHEKAADMVKEICK